MAASNFFTSPRNIFFAPWKFWFPPPAGFYSRHWRLLTDEKLPAQSASYTHLLPRKTLQPSTWSINYLYESELGVYGCDTPTRHNPAQNAGWFWRIVFLAPYFSPRIIGGLFFAKSLKIFPKPVIVFTTCAEKVCYKVCNTYSKVWNKCSKALNTYYKVGNKNHLIWAGKLSCW